MGKAAEKPKMSSISRKKKKVATPQVEKEEKVEDEVKDEKPSKNQSNEIEDIFAQKKGSTVLISMMYPI